MTLRDETEWTELVEAGWNHFAMPVTVDAAEVIIEFMNSERKKNLKPYGDGYAAEAILNKLADLLNCKM